MVSHGLLICSFKLKKKFTHGEDDDYILLNKDYEYDGVQYDNFWDLLEEFVSYYKEYTDNDKLMKMFAVKDDSVKKTEKDTYTIFSGIIQSGSYGIESKITNKDTKEVVYNRHKEDADIKDFQFFVYVPKGKEDSKVFKGILMFEMTGSFGVKTITTHNMKSFFSEKFDLTFETSSISARIFIEELLQNEKLTKVTLVKNKVSKDPADNMFVSVGREETSYFKPKLSEGWIKKILNFVDGKDSDEIMEISDEYFQDIVLSFTHMGRNKTVKLSNLDRFSLIEDIPKSVYNGADIDRERLIKYMEETACKYAEKIVFAVS